MHNEGNLQNCSDIFSDEKLFINFAQNVDTMTQITMSIPNNEVDFFSMLAKRMGWEFNASTSALDRFVADGPVGSDISDEDILDEVCALRHSR